MNRHTWVRRVAAGVVLAGAVGVAGPAPAGAVTVTTDDQLKAAFADPAVELIEMAGDIDIDCATDAISRPSNAVPVTIDGGGATLRDVCTVSGSTILASSPFSLVDLDLIGRDAPGGQTVLAIGMPVTFERVRMVLRGGVHGVNAGSPSRFIDVQVEGPQGPNPFSVDLGAGDETLFERVTITSGSSGIGSSGSAQGHLVVRDSHITVGYDAVDAFVPTTIERSSLRAGRSALFAIGETTLVTDSTLVADEALTDGEPNRLGAAIDAREPVVVQNSTLIAGGPSPLNASPTIALSGNGRVDLHASALVATDGHEVCRGDATTSAYVVATDDTCGLGATDQVVAGAGLTPYIPAEGIAPPLIDGPLVDAVPTAECRTMLDQLSGARPSGPACDIGAVELQRPEPAPPTTPPPTTPARPAAPVVGPARFTG